MIVTASKYTRGGLLFGTLLLFIFGKKGLVLVLHWYLWVVSEKLSYSIYLHVKIDENGSLYRNIFFYICKA